MLGGLWGTLADVERQLADPGSRVDTRDYEGQDILEAARGQIYFKIVCLLQSR